MGFAHRAFVAAGVGFAVSAIVGCGSSGGSWLSASQSNSLTEQLNRVTQALDDQRCSDARQYLADFQSQVDSLGGVNSTLISNLDQGASTIQSLANRDCQTVKTPTTPKKTQPKTTTTTTPTQTTSTFTVPSTTTTYSTPSYTTTTYSTPSTTTTGGSCPTCGLPTTTSPTTTTSTVTTTTTPTGGTGLGGGSTTYTPPSTTTTTTTTTPADTTTTSTGAGF
jgi:hypothetical protein